MPRELAGCRSAEVKLKLMPHELSHVLACPDCASPHLSWGEEEIICDGCGSRYPRVDGVPILLHRSSVFSRADIGRGLPAFFAAKPRLVRLLDAVTPKLALNVAAARNFGALSELLSPGSTVVVIGGGVVGEGFHTLLARDDLTIIETDVSPGPRTRLVCDAHRLPFLDGSVDAVVAQAVLEHVVDPRACVAEMHRILRPSGIVYAEVPFMQPVHGGRYDFTRFSLAGLFQLFGSFEEIKSGVACGPASALAYSLAYCLQALARPGSARKIVGRIARFVAAPVKYLDLILARTESALDGASSLYFLGRSRTSPRAPRDLIAQYRGGFR